jgi:hypothetical protein
LLPALEKGFGDWKGKLRDWLVTVFAGVEARIFVQMAASDCAGYEGTGGAAIFEEAAACERFIARLIVHVLAAGGGEEEHDSSKYNCGAGDRRNRLSHQIVAGCEWKAGQVSAQLRTPP